MARHVQNYEVMCQKKNIPAGPAIELGTESDSEIGPVIMLTILFFKCKQPKLYKQII